MVKPRVHIGTDHAGLDLSHRLIGVLRADGYEVVDHGPRSFDPLDDYPGFCIATAEGVAADAHRGIPAFGIVIGGSGNGEQMAANKVAGIRAALVWNDDTARLARAHNDANVVSIGARQHTPEVAIELVRTFLAEPFSGEARHVRRIGQIAAYEAERFGA
jgi:ribose 5-phosphate isomerase B